MLRMDKVFDNKQRNMRVDQVLKEVPYIFDVLEELKIMLTIIS